MVEHLIREHMDDDSPLHPDLLRSFLEQRRRVARADEVIE
jgi:hypothetical protein